MGGTYYNVCSLSNQWNVHTHLSENWSTKNISSNNKSCNWIEPNILVYKREVGWIQIIEMENLQENPKHAF